MSAVVDASALLEAWLCSDADELRARLADESLHAPQHLHVEVANVLRRQRNAGLLTPEKAEQAYREILSVPVQLWPFRTVADRVWGLGTNATSYDAAYLALAEHLGVDLITHDAKLERIPGIRCRVDCY